MEEMFLYPGPSEESEPVSADSSNVMSALGICDSISVKGEGISDEEKEHSVSQRGHGAASWVRREFCVFLPQNLPGLQPLCVTWDTETHCCPEDLW